jgi:glycosyltransferase involved in cell wall biosynthesis
VAKVSVILAARNERHLPRMVAHLLTRLTGDFEILVGFDGPPYVALPDDEGLQFVHAFNFEHRGLKPTINDLAARATGKYLLKLDSHCAVSDGLDETLQQHIEPNWMVVPRFYTLDEASWAPRDARFCDYWYLDCPLTDPKGYRFKAGGYWFERTEQRRAVGPMDETLTHHGSCWFVERDFFLNTLGGMQVDGYGLSYMEPADLGLRTWLGPWEGKVMVNKAGWYGHLHQQASARGYGISMREIRRSYRWTAEYHMRDRWPQQAKPLRWLIDRFAPVPTWPADWPALQALHVARTPWDKAWETHA